MSDRTRVLNPVPSAGKPGMGGGNVPFAPGLMSGRNLGQATNPQPLARQSTGMARGNPPQSAPPPAPQGQVPAASPQPPAPPANPDAGAAPGFTPPGMMGPTNPWPQIYMQLLDSWLKAIMASKDKPLIGGMY
jgi:hypothetical protein